MSSQFTLSKEKGYFKNQGVDVMAFDDVYPAGHQSGVSIIMHGHRIATNGDVRFEQTPGQWQPIPKQKERVIDTEKNTITTTLSYPDHQTHLRGFNPMIFPDFELEYQVRVTGLENGVLVQVDLDREIPEEFYGKLCFNLELFPGSLFGKAWLMDEKTGIFPPQPNAPTQKQSPNYLHSMKAPSQTPIANQEALLGLDKGYSPIVADDLIAAPYAEGQRFTLCPEDELTRFTVESKGAKLKLYDGRMNHNNGWFVLSSEIPMHATKNAIEWLITPSVVEGWLYKPVVQVSQVGYHPDQRKVAVIEVDEGWDVASLKDCLCRLVRFEPSGEQEVFATKPVFWGAFLRYNYLLLDFSGIKESGMYQVKYGDSESAVFRISENVYERGVWQPVLEYFLPVQMCHMRVNEKYRVWHGRCHCDDGTMAPLNLVHFDGCVQGASTMTKYQPGDHVPGLNRGGWHDAGDFDLRIESQTYECYSMALAFEEFGVDYDETTIDQTRQIAEIHQPDGKNDILQQIEHGLLSVVGAYKSMGRLYHDIICRDLRQYVLLGDPVNMTDGVVSDDDRYVFMEDNPQREFTGAAHLAAAARAMRGFNDEMAGDALAAAEEIYAVTKEDDIDSLVYAPGEAAAVVKKSHAKAEKMHAAVELFLSTGKQEYRDYVVANVGVLLDDMGRKGWILGRAVTALNDPTFTETVRNAALKLKAFYDEEIAQTPYGIPYHPFIWGAGWDIQQMGANYYFLYKAFPDIFDREFMCSALNFVLGCHPGSNTSSFASGVGAKSTTVAYGFNRADWSYIPGGVASGTALIRPDFPELLEFPFLWQQMEYVLGGGSSNYMFLVLAVEHLLKEGR